MREPATRRIVLLSLALLAVRALSLVVVAQPGYTDAYYYAAVAERLARGEGLSADFVWNFLEAPGFAALPVPSHRFWMPLASALGAAGIAALGPLLGTFRAAQLPIVLVAALLPWLTWRAARQVRRSARRSSPPRSSASAGSSPRLGRPRRIRAGGSRRHGVLPAYGRAASGSARAGLPAGSRGLACGILFLARAEVRSSAPRSSRSPSVRPRAARPGGSAVALAIGSAWLARDAAVGGAGDAARKRACSCEDFFALRAVDAARSSPRPATPSVRASARSAPTRSPLPRRSRSARAAARVGLWTARSRADVRAFAALALLVYLAERVWTLHATRGSYFHSLAAFFPFAVALAVVGAERGSRRGAGTPRRGGRGARRRRDPLGRGGAPVGHRVQRALPRVRAAALDALPAGPLLAIDGAAWRWIARRPASSRPPTGWPPRAASRARTARARSLRAAHFRALRRALPRRRAPAWLGPATVRGPVRIFPVVAPPPCVP